MSEKMSREAVLRQKLAVLRAEHRELDRAITGSDDPVIHDSFSLQRMKKRKLALKDEIARIEDEITPDIIA